MDDNGPAVRVEEKGVGGMGEWFVVGGEVWEDKEGGVVVVEGGWQAGSGGAHGNADCLFEFYSRAQL